MSDSKSKPTITVRDAVEIVRQETGLNFQPSTIHLWVRQKRVKAKKFGKFLLIDEKSFRDFLKSKFTE